MTTLNHALSPTERTRVRRHSERAQTERADLFAVLDAGMICHLGVVVNGAPVVLGTARIVTDEAERLAGLRAVTEHLIPGRWDAVRPPTRKELAATSVLALPLAEASVKVRTGPPKDEPEDLGAGIWAGVLPLGTTFSKPVPDPELPAGIGAPDHIRARMYRDSR